jgi:autotransporter-associated beta strand protein
MKATSLLAFVSLCLLTANARAVEFPTTDVPSGAGAVVHIYGTWEDWEQRLNKLHDAGGRVARIDFIWEMIDHHARVPGQPVDYDWSGYDNVVAKCEELGIRIYANLLYANPLYGDGIPRSDPAYFGTQSFRDGFTEYAMATVDRYKGKNFTWEVWNEPNYGFWPGQDANQYMALANQVLSPTTGIRTVDPTATIVGPSLSATVATENWQYLTDCFNYGNTHAGQYGLLDLVDGVSVHPYRWGNNRNPESVLTDPTQFNYADLRTLMNDTSRWANGSNVQIVNTEMGYTTTWSGMTLQTQADYVQRMLLVDASQHLPLSITYDLIDDGTDPNDGEHNFGLCYNDLTPKPAYYALKTFNKTLEGMTVLEGSVNVNSTNPINHLTFTAGTYPGARLTLAAWTADGANHVWDSAWCGTHLLTDTPLYVGQQWAWQGGLDGNWGSPTGWCNYWAWTNAGWQAQINDSADISIDGNQEFTVSGLQLNAPGIRIYGGGKLRFTVGGGSINTGANDASIDAVIADADDNDPNNAASFVLRKCGTGTLNLGGANTVHGRLLIGQGGVQLYNPLAAQNLTVDINSAYDTNGSLVNGSLIFAPNITTFTLGGLAGTQPLNAADGEGLAVGLFVGGNNADTIYSGVLSGGGFIAKVGTGNLTLSGANTYGGQIGIGGGMLTMGDAQALGITDTYSIPLENGGCLNLNGYSSGTTNNNDTRTSKNLARTITIDQTGGLANTNTEYTSTYSGTISDATPGTPGSLTKYGAGTLILSGPNTYTGATIINEGTLKLGAAHVLGSPYSADITLNGGTLDFWGWSTPGCGGWDSTDLSRAITVTTAGGGLSNTDTDNGVAYTPNITAHANFTVDTPDSLIDLRGAVTCPNAAADGWPQLIKTGSGGLLLGGNANNAYLTVNAAQGTVVLNKTSSDSVHSAVAVAVGPGATVNYCATGGNYQIQQDNGAWLNLYGGTVNFNGANQIGTPLIVNAGSVGSTITNTSTTESTYSPSSSGIYANFTVDTPNAANSIILSGGLVCPDAEAHGWPHLTKTGDGTLRLSGTADNSDLTLIAQAGTVKLDKLASNVFAAAAAEVDAGATVQYTGVDANENQINPGGWINVYGGTVDFNGKSQNGTNLTIENATSTLANTTSGTLSTYSPNSMTINSDFSVDGAGDLKLVGQLWCVGGDPGRTLTKNGSGTLTLGDGEATNNSRMILQVNNGIVRLNKNSDTIICAAGLISGINTGATVQYLGSGSNQVYSASSITLSGGTLDFNGKDQTGTTLNVSIAASTLANTASGTLSTYTPTAINLTTGLTVNGAGNLAISGPISGAGSLTKSDGGVLTLSGNNTYTGTTTINAGTLMLGSDHVLGNATSTITLAGGCLDLWGYSSPENNSAWPSTDLGRAITITAAGGGLSNTDTTYVSKYSGVISGSTGGLLTKYGAGDLVLSGTNTYTGGTTINAGTLTMGSTQALGASTSTATVTLAGGCLNMNGKNLSRPMSVTAGSTLANTSSTASTLTSTGVSMSNALTVNAVGDLTISGKITGAGSLTKTGKGLLTLTGGTTASNYSGGTTISAGNLRFSNSNSCPTGANSITIGSDGALVANGAFSNAQNWLNSGRISTASNGALAIAANTAGINLSTGSYNNLSIGSTGAYTLSGTITPANNAYRFGGGGGTLTVSGNLADQSSPTVARTLTTNGNVVLTGTNTYTGGTTINAGNLRFNASGSCPAGANSITINSAGALVANGAFTNAQNWINSGRINTTSNGALAITANTAGINLSTGSYNNLSIGSTGAYTLSGTITPGTGGYRFGGGGGTLTVSSNLANNANALTTQGNVTLTSANLYTGATTVNSGTLTLNGSGRINSTSGITLNSGGTLLQNNTSSTALDRTITFNGGAFGGSGTYNGSLTVGNGHLSPGTAGVGSVGTFTQTGNLTLDSTSVLDFDFGTTANTCDQWAFSGTGRSLILDGTINITCSGNVAAGTNYTIFSGGAVTDHGLDFGILPGGTGHDWSYRVSGNSVIITAAPEPGTLVLIGTALLSLLAHAWRKRK